MVPILLPSKVIRARMGMTTEYKGGPHTPKDPISIHRLDQSETIIMKGQAGTSDISTTKSDLSCSGAYHREQR